MTRATWPLSREAVEAAARKRRALLVQRLECEPWEALGEARQAELLAEEAEITRELLAAWEPSLRQCHVYEQTWSTHPGDAFDTITAALLAAVRTEAAE